MKSIEKLTKDQEDQLKLYSDKCISKGLSTDDFDVSEAISICQKFNNKILNKGSIPVVVLDNPIYAWIAVCMFSNMKSDQDWDQVWDQVWSQVRDQVGSQVWSQVGDQVRSQVGDQVWSQVGDQVWSQVRSQVWDQVTDQVTDQVRDQVGSQVTDQVRSQVGDYISPYTQGSFDVNIFGFYDYCFEVLKTKPPKELIDKYNIWKSTIELGLIWFTENMIFVSRKPTQIHKNELGLHADEKPALEYKGGFKIYSLWGVRCPEWLVMTPSEKLNIKQYNELSGADQKMCFVRKFGIDRMLEFGKKLDTYQNYDEHWWTESKYELYDMCCLFDGVGYAPHLKMTNQTTGVFHVEAVSPNCKTIRDAVNERLGNREIELINIK